MTSSDEPTSTTGASDGGTTPASTGSTTTIISPSSETTATSTTSSSLSDSDTLASPSVSASSASAAAPTTTVVDPALLEPLPHTHGMRHGHSYAYSLVSWGSVFAGAVIAVVIGVMLNILGVAFGVTALEPGDPSGASAGDLTVGAGIWLLLSTVVGLVVGGYVAARAATDPDHHEGALHGAAVWAVSFLLAFFLTGSFVSGTAFSALQGAGAAAETVREAGPGRAVAAARDVAGATQDEDAADTPAEARTEEAADNAADAVAGAAFWAFATMAASLIGAMIGGTIGARHDDRVHRPRRKFADVI